MKTSFWLTAWNWMVGRRTYIVAFVLVLAVTVLVFLGRLTPTVAMAIGLMALGLFAATFRAALAEHSAQVLDLLGSVAALGVAARQHNKEAEPAAAETAAVTGAQLGAEIAQENKAAKETAS